MLKNCRIFAYGLLLLENIGPYFFLLVCTLFPRKTGKKCGRLENSKKHCSTLSLCTTFPLGLLFSLILNQSCCSFPLKNGQVGFRVKVTFWFRVGVELGLGLN